MRDTHRFPNILISQEELPTQILLGNKAIVDDSQRANAGKSEVLRNLGAQRAEGDEEDVRRADAFLRLGSPQSDLPVVEGDFVCAETSS